jgi:hypothetical protein
MKDTVILYGTNTFTRHLIDWSRDDCEYWCWNEIGSLKDDRPGYWAKRVDLLLQMHAPPIWRNPENANHGRQQKLDDGTMSNSHYDWLQRPHDIPIYMQEKYEDVPASVRYPFEGIVQALLPNIWRDTAEPGAPSKRKQILHFTSSTAYAIALALYMGAKQIELHGIEMTSDTEYTRQRDGVTFWLGVAVGRGVNVVIHSPLFMTDKLYGYTGEVVIQKQQFEMATRKLEGEILPEAQRLAHEAAGRTQALLSALLKTTSQADAARLAKELIQAMNVSQNMAVQLGQATGAANENRRYMQQCDALIKAAGGEKALDVLMRAESVPVEEAVPA